MVHQRFRESLVQVAYVCCVTLSAVLLITLTARHKVHGQRMKVPDDAAYTKFQHVTEYHARLPCALCHRRNSDSVRPTLPGSPNHSPCAGCHVKQFADTSSAICSICHSNPQAGTLKAFPRLSSFGMTFDHARHVSMGGVGCVSCHRPSRGGVAMSVPNGSNAHAVCFRCHTPQAQSQGRDISSCGVCHQSGRSGWSSQMAAAIRIGFSHEKHSRDEGLNCNDCHRVRSGARVDVTAPTLLNHHASRNSLSCLSCHNGKRAFGGDDFSACKRCHQGSAWRF
jgi:c(7)-type cytochrome triheme protein